jgi:hypothetical protein
MGEGREKRGVCHHFCNITVTVLCYHLEGHGDTVWTVYIQLTNFTEQSP